MVQFDGPIPNDLNRRAGSSEIDFQTVLALIIKMKFPIHFQFFI